MTMSQENIYTLKYIIVGDSGVGKSSIMIQFTERRFSLMHDITIGVEFAAYIHTIGNDKIRLQIWDTAGQESFRSITRSYYRGAACAFVVFDITNRESFNNIKSWMNDVQNYSNFPITIILIGNKSDLEDKREVSSKEAEELAQKNNITYIETSAKNCKNINKVFIDSIENIYFGIKSGMINLPNMIYRPYNHNKEADKGIVAKNNSCGESSRMCGY
jgi:Ras-related protein Rab-2A